MYMGLHMCRGSLLASGPCSSRLGAPASKPDALAEHSSSQYPSSPFLPGPHSRMFADSSSTLQLSFDTSVIIATSRSAAAPPRTSCTASGCGETAGWRADVGGSEVHVGNNESGDGGLDVCAGSGQEADLHKRMTIADTSEASRLQR